MAGLLAAALLPAPAFGLINPKQTVADLVRDSGSILLVRVAAPKDGKLTAEVTGALVGQVPADKQLTFDFSQAEDLPDEKITAAFAGAPSATAVMVILKNKQDGARVGALEIGTTWMGLTQADAAWKLDRDPKDLETVWAGSARSLVPAIRYALSDPAADFPVASLLSWDHDANLGKLDGPAHGALALDLGDKTVGPCVLILSSGGDRVFQLSKGAAPIDITKTLALTSRSKALTAGYFNGTDGLLDLASWDGAKLWLLLRRADGTFAPPTGGYEIADVRSLHALAGGILAATPKGLTWFAPDTKGTLTPQKLPAPPELATLGPGGVATVADFNDDGLPDLLQVFANGLVFYAGTPTPGTFAAPVVTKLATCKDPTSVLAADFDTDGQLDLLVAGTGGATLLCRDEAGHWTPVIAQTGELGASSGLGQGDTTAVATGLADVNGDGRQSLVLFHAAASPALFFNRGFACFGVARTAVLGDAKFPAAEALGSGQETGLVCDLNGDLTPDLLAVDRQHNVWAVLGKPAEPRRFNLTLVPPTIARDPLTVTASLATRPLGTWVLAPGQPVSLGLRKASKLTLRYKTPTGAETKKDTMVFGAVRAQP